MSRIVCCLLCAFTALALSTADASGQIMQQQTQDNSAQLNQIAHQVEAGPQKVPKEVKVVVEADKPRGVLMPWTLGVHSLVSDSHMTDGDVIALLHAAGITTLRYPGGGSPTPFIGQPTMHRLGRGSVTPMSGMRLRATQVRSCASWNKSGRGL